MFNFLDKKMLLLFLSQILLGMLGALLLNLLLLREAPPTIATVNITALEDSFIRETSKSSMTEMEMKQKVQLFSLRLDQSMKQLAKERGLIIVPSEAVLAGSSIDLTQVVASDVKRGLS